MLAESFWQAHAYVTGDLGLPGYLLRHLTHAYLLRGLRSPTIHRLPHAERHPAFEEVMRMAIDRKARMVTPTPRPYPSASDQAAAG